MKHFFTHCYVLLFIVVHIISNSFKFSKREQEKIIKETKVFLKGQHKDIGTCVLLRKRVQRFVIRNFSIYNTKFNKRILRLERKIINVEFELKQFL